MGRLTDRQRRKLESGGVERIWSRKEIEQAFIETFDLIGGIPRLALWANNEENYGEFLKLLMRLAPKDVLRKAATVLEYRSNVPSSPLARRGAPEDVEEGRIIDGSTAAEAEE
jgi:hypothetical protein